MSKIYCEVIRDLLPSYVDGICSEESQKLIEDHLASCEACTQWLHTIKATELVSEGADRKGIDYIGRLKRHMANRGVFHLCVLLFFILAGFGAILKNYGNVPIELYYMIQPLLLLDGYFMLSDYKCSAKRDRWTFGVGAISIFLLCYSVALQFLCVDWIRQGSYPWGLSDVQVGPFVSYQLVLIALLQAVLFLIMAWKSIQTANPHRYLLNLSGTGSCVALAMYAMLKTMDTMERFLATRNRILLVFVMEGVVTTLILTALEHRTQRKIDS